MEADDPSAGIDREEQPPSAFLERTYDDGRGYISDSAEKERKEEETFADDGLDAELDYDEENRDSERASSISDADQELFHNDDGCAISDDDLDAEGSRGDSRNELRDGDGEGNVDEEGEQHADVDEASKRNKREPSEEGEIDDLEEGELRSDNESDSERGQPPENKKPPVKSKPVEKPVTQNRDIDDSEIPNVCKFYLRGNCTWGSDCKYVHPHEGSRERFPSGSKSKINRRPSADRERVLDRPSIHSRVTYPTAGADKPETSGARGTAEESAWERGLRQARELMKKATKKKEEEPDFEKKRLVLAPSEEVDRRTTDGESDDSHSIGRVEIREGLSPRRVARLGNGPNVSAYGDDRLRAARRPERFDEPINANDIPLGRGSGYRNERPNDNYGRGGGYSTNTVNRGRIPSLIDGIRESRMVEVKKDLGPQVLYPNGRPNSGNRRRDGNVGRRNNSRDMPINERYYVPRRASRSPRSVSRSPVRSPSPPRRSNLPASRSGSERSEPLKKQRSLGINLTISDGGANIRDPWDRSQKKRNRSRELPPTTLGAVLQNARLSDERSRSRKRQHSSSGSESSVSGSTTSSLSRSSSSDRRKAATRASLASAVPLKNLFDDDGSIRQTDLSSFRIPKKKRPSRSPTRAVAAPKKPDSKIRKIHGDSFPRGPVPPSQAKWQRDVSPQGRVQQSQKGAKAAVSSTNVVRHERKLSEAKEKISSDESSSSRTCSSSSDEDTEPAAYRRKRKSQADDDGLPTEGIPLSPEAAAEDISSDEDEERTASPKKSVSRSLSRSPSRSASERRSSISPERVENAHDSNGERPDEQYAEEEHFDGCDDYVDDEAEKEERRAELLRQLKYVEDAIARKRNRPVA